MDTRSWFLRLISGTVLLSWLLSASLFAAEPGTAAPATPVKPPAEDSAESQRVLRSYLQLQEQLHATLLAIEQSRIENTAAAHTNSEALAARLEMIEKSLAQSREQQMESMRNSNRTMLTLAGIFVGVGFLTLLFMAFFQLRGMNRLAEIATGMPGGQFPALGSADPRLLGAGGENAQSSRLHGVISRLEQRIEELEGAAHASPSGNGHSERKAFPVILDVGQAAANHVTVVLGKGQALLNLGQAENALLAFEEALTAAPDHAEAHVRKGQALERLKRFDEALASYDRAIALDRSLTQAYLAKGGMFNQQERFSEALTCYEQALRSEAKA